MSDKVKFIVAILFLFGAVAVDFVSKILSVGFDLFFISAAIWVVYPIIIKEK